MGYIDTFMLKQRAKEFANYLLLGTRKKKLTDLFLCEIILLGLFCFGIKTTAGFCIYRLFYFHTTLHETGLFGFLYVKSMIYTLFTSS